MGFRTFLESSAALPTNVKASSAFAFAQDDQGDAFLSRISGLDAGNEFSPRSLPSEPAKYGRVVKTLAGRAFGGFGFERSATNPN